MARRANPHYDAGAPHHTPDGFRNPDPAVRIGGDVRRWRRERRASGVPLAPEGGYARFAHRWRVRPEFRIESAHDAPVAWWLGHATVLLRVAGMHLITDPHLSPRASPLSFAGPRRRVDAPATVAELPRIDLALISHNHYDHLDSRTVRALIAANPQIVFCVPLGLGRWMRRRGVRRVHELDWWERREHGALELHCVPAQHWSMRTPFDRNRSLWSGWAVRHGAFSFYFSGDTGYTPRLAEIAWRLGPPSLAALPIGAYEPRWFMRGQHVDPAEAVRLHRELAVGRSLAIHWGTFELADDRLDAPPEALGRALGEAGVDPGEFWLVRQGEARVLEGFAQTV